MKQLSLFGETAKVKTPKPVPRKKVVARPLAYMPKFQPLKKRFYPITGWQLDEPWYSRLREGKREEDTRLIVVLAANRRDFEHFCFERGIQLNSCSSYLIWNQEPEY